MSEEAPDDNELGKAILEKYQDEREPESVEQNFSEVDISKTESPPSIFMTDASESSYGDSFTTASGDGYFSESATDSLSMSLATSQSILDMDTSVTQQQTQRKKTKTKNKKEGTTGQEAHESRCPEKPDPAPQSIQIDVDNENKISKPRQKKEKKVDDVLLTGTPSNKDDEIRDYLKKDFKNTIPAELLTSSEEFALSDSQTEGETDDNHSSMRSIGAHRKMKKRRNGHTSRSELHSSSTKRRSRSRRHHEGSTSSKMAAPRSSNLDVVGFDLSEKSVERSKKQKLKTDGERKQKTPKSGNATKSTSHGVSKREKKWQAKDTGVKEPQKYESKKQQEHKLSDDPILCPDEDTIDASSASLEKLDTGTPMHATNSTKATSKAANDSMPNSLLHSSSSDLHRETSKSPRQKKRGGAGLSRRHSTATSNLESLKKENEEMSEIRQDKPRRMSSSDIRKPMSSQRRRSGSRTPSIQSESQTPTPGREQKRRSSSKQRTTSKTRTTPRTSSHTPENNSLSTGKRIRATSVNLDEPKTPIAKQKPRAYSLNINHTPVNSHKHQKGHRSSDISLGATSRGTMNTVRTSQSLPVNLPRTKKRTGLSQSLTANPERRGKSTVPPKRARSADSKRSNRNPTSTKSKAPGASGSTSLDHAQRLKRSSKSKSTKRGTKGQVGTKLSSSHANKNKKTAEKINSSGDNASSNVRVSLNSHIAGDSQGHDNLRRLKPVPSSRKLKGDAISSFFMRADDGQNIATHNNSHGNDVYSRSEASTISGSSASATGWALTSNSSSIGNSRLSKSGSFTPPSTKNVEPASNPFISYFGGEDEIDDTQDVFATDSSATAVTSNESFVSYGSSLLSDFSTKNGDAFHYSSDGKAPSSIPSNKRKIISPFSLHADAAEAMDSSILASHHTQATFASPLIPDSDDEESGSFDGGPSGKAGLPEEGKPAKEVVEKKVTKEKLAEEDEKLMQAQEETSPPKHSQKIVSHQVSNGERPSSKKQPAIEDFEDPLPRNSQVKKAKRMEQRRSNVWDVLCCRSRSAVMK